MLYEIREGTDGQTYCFLITQDEITQADFDNIISSFDVAGISDWNIEDICAELGKSGIEAEPVEPTEILWIQEIDNLKYIMSAHNMWALFVSINKARCSRLEYCLKYG